ncbi:apolipoprotein N-acyltransferase [Wenxinia marina]|uniref:Apolipoprotein N-acyltransferase n=1 Tax=Wenxinia marina DSM 24838 TaxID=1123501 RepID=A0A0D0PDC4_9RHOB|nr:apolipoprotein N-acyltransferase [Wenxinia marina]KIQ69476.1 Apolipoprotein N-acyltransferase [Wenxinia marina DSM 24838]GGL58654.1 apolipoprotein N-acyltransferase [Wenxinia marina]
MNLIWTLPAARVISLPSRMTVACAAGGLAVLTLPPFSILLLVPVAYATLLVLLRHLSVAKAALVGWAFGLGQFGFGLSWIAESFYVDAERFAALAIPAVAVLSAGLAIFPAIAAALFAGVAQRRAIGGVLACLLFATCWTTAEWLRGHLLTGFPWNLAGYALVEYAALRQPAAWVGSYGLSFLVVLAGTLPAAAFLARGRHRWDIPLLGVGIVVVAWNAGTARLQLETPGPSGVDLRIVQGNVPQQEKWAPENREATLTRYLELSTRPGPVDILLWPETAFPGFLDEDVEARSRIAAAIPAGALLLTGVPDRVSMDGGTSYFNSVQAYDQSGEFLTGYAKHHLVPFGEYMPFRGWLPIDRLTQGLGDFTPGPGPRTLALPGVPLVAVAICYEIIFPGHVVDDLFRPDWIFNATNDAWFGTSIGPEQHLASARMRAVEEGLPIVRAANTGISAVIDANGDLAARLGTGETGVIGAALPFAHPPTLYARFGDWTLLALIFATWAVGLAAGLVGTHRGNKKTRTETKSCW